jgi:hypothetical protein
MTSVLTTLAPATLLPDPGTGRAWLREELTQPRYRESLADRFNRWFDELVAGAQDVGRVGLHPVLALVLLLLVGAAAAFLLSRLRANPASAEGSTAVFTGTRLGTVEHRRLASSALAEGRWDDAVVEAVRALASGLFERGLVEEHTDMTVQELVAGASRTFPRHRARLAAAGRVFDETRYGERPAREEEARDAVGLELELSTHRPEGDPRSGPVLAVPR